MHPDEAIHSYFSERFRLDLVGGGEVNDSKLKAMGLLDYSFATTWAALVSRESVRQAFKHPEGKKYAQMNLIWLRKLLRNCYLALFAMYNEYRCESESNCLNFLGKYGVLGLSIDNLTTKLNQLFGPGRVLLVGGRSVPSAVRVVLGSCKVICPSCPRRHGLCLELAR